MQETATRREAKPLRAERRAVDRGRLEIWCWSSGHHALHAAQRYAAGEVLHGFSSRARVDVPTRHSVQVGEQQHILLEPLFIQYINHGCDPNVSFDVRRMEILALRPIATGEELLFFYPSTEWVMTEPFRCHCRAPQCLGEIQGAAFFPAHFKSSIPLSAHINAMLARQLAANVAAPVLTALVAE